MVHVSHFQNNKSTILLTLSSEWTWDEIYKSEKVIRKRLQQYPSPVILIMDLSEFKMMPRGILKHARNLLRLVNPHIKHIVFVGTHPIIRISINTINRLYGTGYWFEIVDTMQTASEKLPEWLSGLQVTQS